MGISINKPLNNPVLVAAWPGIGNVGLLAVEALRDQLKAEKIGELGSGRYFFPARVEFRGPVLDELAVPYCDFYYHPADKQDILFFTCSAQPETSQQCWAMAGAVLDAAVDLHCRRVYTAAAGVCAIHHEDQPKVHIVATGDAVVRELLAYPNTTGGMGEAYGHGVLQGLNGLLVGLARRRGLEGACLLGEVPDYLAGGPFPLPRTAQSIFRLFRQVLGLGDLPFGLEELARQADGVISEIYGSFPLEVRDRIAQRRQARPGAAGEITSEEGTWLKNHIGELFHPPGKAD